MGGEREVQSGSTSLATTKPMKLAVVDFTLLKEIGTCLAAEVGCTRQPVGAEMMEKCFGACSGSTAVFCLVLFLGGFTTTGKNQYLIQPKTRLCLLLLIFLIGYFKQTLA